ncbi:dihydroorotate dehydrogenase-like protein [candidate division KSB1 bacterium]
MNLSTKYMGFELKNPIVPSSSPLMRKLDNIKKMEDAGASAVVLDSLFEEQIKYEAAELNYFLEHGTDSFQESTSFFPSSNEFFLGPELYLERLRKIKEAVDIPVFASLNGIDAEKWTEHAKLIEEAGADGLELNIYFLETGFNIAPGTVEKRYHEILDAVKSNVNIPVAVKLSPYFSSMASFAKEMSDSGADGLVLFNRFYQPDLDIEELKVDPHLVLSNPDEIRLPIRWIAILFGHINASMAVTSGIHDHISVLKALMAGADITQMTSVLLMDGISKITEIINDLEKWMVDHEYESVDMMKGSLSQKSCPDPAAFERANYLQTLQSFK